MYQALPAYGIVELGGGGRLETRLTSICFIIAYCII